MANYIICCAIFKILFPILMSVCISFRPSALGLLYFLFMLYFPFVPVPTTESMQGHTGLYLKILILVASLTTLSQIIFQVALAALPPYGGFLQACESYELILRHIGYIRLDNMTVVAYLTWLTPEILLLAISITVFVVLRKLTIVNTPPEGEEHLEGGAGVISSTSSSEVPRKHVKAKYLAVLVSFGRYLVLIALCLAAVLRPSVVGGIYFLVFLSVATWWACCKQLRRNFGIFLRCFMPIVAVHMVVFYLYQMQYFQELLPKDNIYARYFGLTPLLSVDCKEDPRTFSWVPSEWATYVNPVALYLLYYICGLESTGLLKPELIRSGVSPARRYGSKRSKTSTVLQDSTGSVTVTGENAEDIQMEQLGKGTPIEEEYTPSVFEKLMYILESLIQVIISSSYIATNIIMMTWSITYLSWLTFVLLIWANLIWLIPNQRKSMLRSSPFLVFYAWFLLISAYIYSLNSTEEEIPSHIQGFNLAQIGFVKVTQLPCNPLLVKCLYTLMFWIALRQYMHEKMEERQTSALADMVAPLQVTVGTATGVRDEKEKGNKIMEKIGKLVMTNLSRFWIWVVAITLFATAITGQRMTVFRIIYMALFLYFILSFQFSFRIWRKTMFGFWLVVIIYSMTILVMIYTYQFDNFPDYWKDYLHIPIQQQLDIGLERYETKRLFVRLVTPTFFVIITVIQLHYFHKDFMQLSDPTNTTITDVSNAENEQSSMQGGAAVLKDGQKDDTITSTTVKFDLSEIGNLSKAKMQILLENWLKRMQYYINLMFLFLELHMPKLTLFMAMLVCVYDRCCFYLIIVILISLALIFGRPMQILAIYTTSVFVSFLLLARMIYQIDYIDPSNWNVTCENTVGNSTVEEIENNAQWFGFEKSNPAGPTLPHLVLWNIIYIITATIFSIVLVRQYNYRLARGEPTKRAFFLFPNITIKEADKNLSNCLKYLANFAFYKFGVEFSLMATVALIGFRMDLYSILYGIWLAILFSLKRHTLSRIWNFYLFFVAVLLPIQYVMVVGLPPSLCIDLPWDQSEILRRVQEWAFLLDPEYGPSPKKLICDFVVLLFVSRQALVFRIESRYAGQNYIGGSNESIIHLAEDKDFVNPTPDFITYVRTYLDIAKRTILLSFLWITLAIVFLAGTNRVNLFSIGYLVGAFIFLWQGSDLYLRPIPQIIRGWNILLGYNVAVIVIKAFLQLLGCVFIREITSNCWMIQLFGVGCVKKFGNVVLEAGIDDPMECKVPREFIGMVWDGLCFGFLIMQRRIFQSYNFFHMINETKATTILASRGAELIEELRLKRMTEMDEQERKILEKIKAKMERIKATQQRMQGPSYKDDNSHFTDTIFKNRPKYRRKAPKTYKEAIRSGDYYMFDDLDDEEIDLEPQEEATGELEEEADVADKHTVSEIQEYSPKSQEPTEPQPGTSKDEDISELTEPRQETFCQRMANYLLFAWLFIESSMVSLTQFLNKYSKDYRYVMKTLSKERKILKERTTYNVGLRVGSTQMWQPAGSFHNLIKQSTSTDSQIRLSEEEEVEMSQYDQPAIFRLFLAIWYIIMSRSELLCYFIIFLNQTKSATFLSLPLPLMVFLWGTLTIPRPSKRFWVTIIAYTEVMVLIKCMFQFDLIPWNRNINISTDPFYPPRIIGIERKKDYAVWDLLLLLVVFFHRFMLKSMGIWRGTEEVPAALLSEGEYKFENGQLVPVHTSSPKASSSKSEQDSDKQHLVEHEEVKERSLASPSSEEAEENNLYAIEGEEIVRGDNLLALQFAASRYAETCKTFFEQLLDPTARVAADVYSYMFLCDFFNFFVILIGYSSFGTQSGDGGVSSYLQDDRVPALFLLMLILQFMLIIIDRGIFLRKNILAKIIFQFAQIFLLHGWLFILFPIMTGSKFNTALPPQMYYMVKCFYLLLSAYQIRCGYPTRILGNFLCKGYNYVNMFLFKGFMLVPFLFELRTVMDWMWTDTSMTIFDWIKMEDIFAHIFQLKCARHAESEYPQPRGQSKPHLIKYIMGGAILGIIVAIIWFPLVFFSLGNAVGEPNIPYDVTLQLRIGPYEPVYQMSAQSNFIFAFRDQDMFKMQQAYSHSKAASTFLSFYESKDIAAVKLSRESASIWGISPPDRKRMLAEINSTQPLTVRLDYKVSHKTSKPEDSGVIPDFIEVILEAENPERLKLRNMLENEDMQPVLLEYILPKFLKITNRGTAKPIAQLMPDAKDERSQMARNMTLKLSSSADGDGKEWWKVREDCSDKNYLNFLKRLPYADQDCETLILYTFNDKIFPATLNIITGGGIIGLYTTLVFVASRVLRGFFAEQCFKIMFEDMPNVDRILQLCFDIYLVRESREYALEEDLFAKLVFLFRSPETLIKWTRPKEETEDEENPEGGE